MHRLAAAAPDDVSALLDAIEAGAIDPARIVAVLGTPARWSVGCWWAFGDPALFVSCSAEHQGAQGGGPVAVIAQQVRSAA